MRERVRVGRKNWLLWVTIGYRGLPRVTLGKRSGLFSKVHEGGGGGCGWSPTQPRSEVDGQGIPIPPLDRLHGYNLGK